MAIVQDASFEIGYKAADDMLEHGAYPTDHELTEFEIHFYSVCASSVLAIDANLSSQWQEQFKKGYLERLDRYCVVGDIEIQQWKRDGEFGVANAPEHYTELFLQHGGHKEPAHYGFQSLHELLRENSWIFPPEAYKPVVALLLKASQSHSE